MKGSVGPEKSKRGRPKSTQDAARPNRIVSFVTDKELAELEKVVAEEERSMAAVVHRIIRAHFEEK